MLYLKKHSVVTSQDMKMALLKQFPELGTLSLTTIRTTVRNELGIDISDKRTLIKAVNR